MVESPFSDPQAVKLLGAFMGAVAALIYFRPINIRALCRFVFSLIVGYLMYFVPIEFMRSWINFDKVEGRDLLAGGSMFSALVSWPIAGIFIKFATKKAEG